MSEMTETIEVHLGEGREVLALMGSPRRGGNTDRLLSETLAAAADKGVKADKIVIRDLKVSPCLEIYQCSRDGHCGIKDDMTRLYPLLTAARAVIVATPIFFYGPSAQTKAVIDRGQALWARKYLLKQSAPEPRGRGYLISAAATGGSRVFEGALLTVRYFFDVLDLEFAGRVLVRGVDEAGDVGRRPDALAEARALGSEIADYVLKTI